MQIVPSERAQSLALNLLQFIKFVPFSQPEPIVMSTPTSEPPQDGGIEAASSDASGESLVKLTGNSPSGDPPQENASAEEAQPAPRDTSEDRYECRSCGYVYEPLKGDDRRNIPPDTPFQSLDVTWRCPVCTAPKMQFSNIGPKGKASGFEENLGYGLGVNVMTPGQKNVLIFGVIWKELPTMMSVFVRSLVSALGGISRWRTF